MARHDFTLGRFVVDQCMCVCVCASVIGGDEQFLGEQCLARYVTNTLAYYS